METNNVKENIRRNLKEKIAISNIRREFDMKDKKNKKVIYWITSSAAVFMLGVGVVVGTNTFTNINIQKPNYEMADLNNEKSNIVQNLNVDLQINKLEGIGVAKLDADTKTVSVENLPNEIKFMESIKMPTGFNKLDIYTLYVRSNQETEKHDLLHDYVFNYKKDSEHEIRIALSTIGEPVRDYFFNSSNKISKIGDVELEILQYEDNYMAKFKLKNMYFDIETNGITENELVDVLQSMITEGNM